MIPILWMLIGGFATSAAITENWWHAVIAGLILVVDFAAFVRERNK